MNLSEYFLDLNRDEKPEFLDRLAQACDRSLNTVKSYVYSGRKVPGKHLHVIYAVTNGKVTPAEERPDISLTMTLPKKKK